MSALSRRTLVCFALVALGACVAEEKPLGERDAIGSIREIFSTRVLGDRTPVEEASVTTITPAGIEWRVPPGPTRRLAWEDVEDVESQTDQEKLSHPETVYLYLRRGAPSIETAAAEKPPLSGAEVVRCYVVLHDRPPGSRARLIRALHVLERHAVKAAPRAGPSEIATPSSASRTTEERLAKLKELHEKGLITDEVYRDEQKKTLSSGY